MTASYTHTLSLSSLRTRTSYLISKYRNVGNAGRSEDRNTSEHIPPVEKRYQLSRVTYSRACGATGPGYEWISGSISKWADRFIESSDPLSNSG